MVVHGKLPQLGPDHDHKLAYEFKEFFPAATCLSTAGLTGSGPSESGKKNCAPWIVADAGSATRVIPGADVEASNEALARCATKNSRTILIADCVRFVYLQKVQAPKGRS